MGLPSPPSGGCSHLNMRMASTHPSGLTQTDFIMALGEEDHTDILDDNDDKHENGFNTPIGADPDVWRC